jgi:hypothetical protein
MNTTLLWRFFFETAGTVTRKATGSTLGGSPLASLPLSGSEKRTIISASISPPLYVNSQVFYSASLSFATVLTPSAFINSQTFYTQNLSITLFPVQYSNAQTFYTQNLSVTLSPALYSDPDTFFAPVVTVAGAGINPSLFTNTQSFFTTSLRLSLSPAAYTNSSSFFSPTLLSSGLVSPALWTNTQTFFSPSILGVARGGLAYEEKVKKRKKLVFPVVEEPSVPPPQTKVKLKKAKKTQNSSAVAKIFSVPEVQPLPAAIIPGNLRSVTREFLDAWFEGNQKAELAAERELQRIAEQSIQDFLRMESLAEKELMELFDLQEMRRQKEKREEEKLIQLAWRAYFES